MNGVCNTEQQKIVSAIKDFWEAYVRRVVRGDYYNIRSRKEGCI